MKINNRLNLNNKNRPQLPLHNLKLKNNKKIKPVNRKNQQLLNKRHNLLKIRKLRPKGSITKKIRKIMKSVRTKKIKPKRKRMKKRRKTKELRRKIRKNSLKLLRMKLMTGMKAKRSMKLE